MKIRMVFLFVGLCLVSVCNAKNNFFKNNEASADTSMLDIAYKSSLSVLKGSSVEIGLFQIRAANVQLVESS